MNNAVFGMENVCNYVNVRFVMCWDGSRANDRETKFSQKKRFFRESSRNRNVETRDKVRQIDARRYVLDISKTCLYEFHHEYILPLFHEN